VAVELTVVMYINDGDEVPTLERIEQTFDVVVTEYDEEEC